MPSSNPIVDVAGPYMKLPKIVRHFPIRSKRVKGFFSVVKVKSLSNSRPPLTPSIPLNSKTAPTHKSCLSQSRKQEEEGGIGKGEQENGKIRQLSCPIKK